MDEWKKGRKQKRETPEEVFFSLLNGANVQLWSWSLSLWKKLRIWSLAISVLTKSCNAKGHQVSRHPNTTKIYLYQINIFFLHTEHCWVLCTEYHLCSVFISHALRPNFVFITLAIIIIGQAIKFASVYIVSLTLIFHCI